MSRHFRFFFALILLAISSISISATECSQVEFNHVKVVCFTKGVNLITREERSIIVEKRLDEISRNKVLDPQSITLKDEGDALVVMLDDFFIFSLREDDFLYSAEEGYKESSENIVKSIQDAIISDREARAPESRIKGIIYSVIATIILLIIIFLLNRLFPRIHQVINEQEKKIPSLKIQRWEVIKSEHVVGLLTLFLRVFRIVLSIIIFYIYVPMILSFFPETANLAPRLLSFILDPIKQFFQAMIDFIPDMFSLLVIGVATHFTLKIVRFFFDEIERGNIKFEGFYKEWAHPTYTLLRVMIMAFAVVMAFPYIPGSSSPAFKGISVFLGVLFSLGSTSAIANIIGGVVLTYMRPFHVGDIVKIADTVGRIKEKNLLVTRIRTIKNVEITIPNSMVLGSHMVNYSSNMDEQGLIVHLTVTFGYDVSWKKVHEMLKTAASRTSLIEEKPAPFILQTALDDFYVHYELNVYTKDPSKMPFIHSELYQNIIDIANENGVELVSTHYSSLRDGNETTLPKEYRDANYKVPGFQIDKN